MKSMKILDFEKRYDIPVALALGFFDCIHKGHQKLCERAIEYAKTNGIESALLTFTNDPNVFFGNEKQLYCFFDRVKVVEKCGLDIVIGALFDNKFASLSPLDFLDVLTSNFNVKSIFVGADYTFGKFAAGNVDLLREYCDSKGISLFVVPFETSDGVKISTSKLKSFVKDGQVDKLNEYLALPYFMSGEVLHARHKGTGMGFPTTNIALDESRLQLENGIYATFCEVDGKVFKSMTNVGAKPTFSDNSISVETYIIDFSGDVYGKNIVVYFIEKMRDIVKFASQAELKAQLDSDEVNAKKILDDFERNHVDSLLFRGDK